MKSNMTFVKAIDASLLRVEATESEIRSFLEMALKYRIGAVSVGCSWIPLAKEILGGSGINIIAPIGYPNGYHTTETKVFETIDSFSNGATEAEVLINVGLLKSGRYEEVEAELKRFVCACGDRVSQAIIETAYLTDEEKKIAVRIAKAAGATFVSTSTGNANTGMAIDDIKLLVKEAGDSIRIKASGNFSTCEEARILLDLGADRIGINNVVSFFEE